MIGTNEIRSTGILKVWRCGTRTAEWNGQSERAANADCPETRWRLVGVLS